jgi:2',3'-cyclic-nucleotide 2'-phosphodiesterase (5'-nucleotidase family)
MGALTYGAVLEAMPFDNQLSKLRLTGAELRSLFRRQALTQRRGPLAVSGIRVKVSCQNDSLLVEVMRINGARIQDDESLTLATSDFLATGGDGVFTQELSARFTLDTGLGVQEALIQGLRELKRVDGSSAELYDPKRPRWLIDKNLTHCTESPDLASDAR